MIKQVIILLTVIGLSACYPSINTAKLNYENDLTKVSKRFDQSNLPSVADLNPETIVQIVELFPGDWTLNDLIIVGTQTVFLEILDMQPVPNWFDGK